MAPAAPGIRLLPNALTVLAMCAGLSAVQFALRGQWEATIAAIGVAAILDSLDGRIARLLDATSKMGAELDSLADAISFGVAPALVLYWWKFPNNRFGWGIALIFAVCMILRLARFNTLLEDVDQPPYAKEFFVGVPAPAGGLLALLPLILTIEYGDQGAWWQSRAAVSLWTVAVAVLLISRIPTLSVKSVKVPPRVVAPLLVGVGLLAAAVITYPFIALAAALLIYLIHIPFAVRRRNWLASHPEAWGAPPRERRAIRREHGNRRSLGLRPVQLNRVAGAARRVRLPSLPSLPSRNGSNGSTREHPVAPEPLAAGPVRRRGWRKTGLRSKTERPETGR